MWWCMIYSINTCIHASMKTLGDTQIIRAYACDIVLFILIVSFSFFGTSIEKYFKTKFSCFSPLTLSLTLSPVFYLPFYALHTSSKIELTFHRNILWRKKIENGNFTFENYSLTKQEQKFYRKSICKIHVSSANKFCFVLPQHIPHTHTHIQIFHL